MLLTAPLKDSIISKAFKYFPFKGKDDEYHWKLTEETVFKYILQKQGIAKEFNIFGFRSREVYLKSTAYFISTAFQNNNVFHFNIPEKVIFKDDPVGIFHLFNICQLYIATIDKTEYLNTHLAIKRYLIAKADILGSDIIHLDLCFNYIRYSLGLTDQNRLISNTFSVVENKCIVSLLSKNSFYPARTEGSSHEFGYLLHFLLEICKLTGSRQLFDELQRIMDELHLCFIRYKIITSDLRKYKKNINISGVLLSANAMMKFTLLSGDLRFANAAFFLMDFVKTVQLYNSGFIPNSFPIYTNGSKLKFPSWTLLYFSDSLSLKKQITKRLMDETGSIN